MYRLWIQLLECVISNRKKIIYEKKDIVSIRCIDNTW